MENFNHKVAVVAVGGNGGGTGNITDIVPAKVFFKQLNI